MTNNYENNNTMHTMQIEVFNLCDKLLRDKLPEELQLIIWKNIWKSKWDNLLNSIIFRYRNCDNCNDFYEEHIHTHELLQGQLLLPVKWDDPWPLYKDTWVVPYHHMTPPLPKPFIKLCQWCR